MNSFRILAVPLSLAMLASPMLYAGDLSRYRGFQLGTDLPTVAGVAQMNVSSAKVIFERPALIQELTWRPQPLGPSAQVEAVKDGVLSFYNGALYRIVITYDRYRTEGLTADDVVAALSATYGTPDRTPAEIILPSVLGGDGQLKVLARWEDAEYSLNLVRFAYPPDFTLVVLSKRLDTLARTAATEAARLDAQEAPQREIELQKKLDEENRAQQERSRQANKPGFRP